MVAIDALLERDEPGTGEPGLDCIREDDGPSLGMLLGVDASALLL